MAAILKTWPSVFPRSKVLEVFNHDWGQFYFSLGLGLPKQTPDELWYTHRGEIIGYFKIAKIIRNQGDNLPRLRSITGEVSEWQIKLMNWVAVCDPPFFKAPERVYHDSFRGWHYFSFDTYRSTIDAKIRM